MKDSLQSHSTHDTEFNDKLSLQIHDLKTQEMLSTGYDSREYDWLSKQFSHTPFRLYKYWLILIFTITFIPTCVLVAMFPAAYIKTAVQMDQIIHMSLITSFSLLLYGCGEMIYAIESRKSRAAQRSFLKFQYHLIGSMIYFAYIFKPEKGMKMIITDWLMYFYLIGAPIINLIGGLAVLRIFRRNNPFRSRDHLEDSKTASSLSTAFLEQNVVIASELSKYEQQLNSWPYLIFNWWLKLAVVFETSVILSCILAKVMGGLVEQITQREFSPRILVFTGALMLSFLNVYSRFEMESAMRTRTFLRSRRALSLLKISVLASILSNLFVAIEVDSAGFKSWAAIIPSLGWPFIFFALIPVLCLIGALKVNKIIELRDSFASVSSLPEDSFLS